MKYLIMVLIALFLAACSGAKTQTPLPIQVQSTSTVTSETRAPSRETPAEAMPLTSTTVPTSTILDFPSWMSNPDTVVLMKLRLKPTSEPVGQG